MTLNEFQQVRPKLTEVRKTRYFCIRFAWSDLPQGEGLGHHGVRNAALIDTYAGSLDRAYEYLRVALRRPTAPLALGEFIEVYLCDEPNPVFIAEFDQPRFIILPVRHAALSLAEALDCARVQAAHEVMHLFNSVQPKPKAPFAAGPWDWFNEGLALSAETWVWPGIEDHYRYLHDWISQPERSLDHAAGTYQTRMFVEYLARRFGRDWVNEVWMNAGSKDGPLQALEKSLAARGQKLFAPEAEKSDVLTDYHREAWFLADEQSHCCEPRITERFGYRATTYNFALAVGESDACGQQLDHLAARYFRVAPTAGAQQLTMRIRTEASTLKAELAVGSNNGMCLQTQMLRSDSATTLTASSPLPAHAEAAYLLLIVTNCGTREQDDKQKFKIEAAAQ